MTDWIVYDWFQKIFRYEMTQHGDIEEPFGSLKSDQAFQKEIQKTIDLQRRMKKRRHFSLFKL